MLASQLLLANPRSLRGMTVKARSGPVRDIFIDMLYRSAKIFKKIHPAISRDALIGGLDFAQTLETGALVQTEGLLRKPGMLILTMAERCSPETAALLARAIDENPEISLVLLDEGAEPDERAPQTLTDRLAFHVSLDEVGRLEAKAKAFTSPKQNELNSLIIRVKGRKTPKEIQELTKLAARLGIDSLRIPILAVTAAQTNAMLNGREQADDTDIRLAAELVLAPRATELPQPEAPPPPDSQDQAETVPSEQLEVVPQDILIEAVRAVLPDNLLDNLNNRDASAAKGSGAGDRRKGNRRGRPVPSRSGRLDGTSRLDLVATLRAAAPWQKFRGREANQPIKVLPDDVHLKRFEEKSDRLIIFAVDASGSAALARLGEAKGAVELLLSRAYATRDQIALIAFRDKGAEVLLPPTRSLVQAKRRLAELPGGGGTPLAHGLKAATELAISARAQGLSPVLAILTDGRANIALDGSADRSKAGEDALMMGRWARSLGMNAIIIDLGMRPQPTLAAIAREMAGTYLPLPRATAERLSDTLGAALDHGLGA